ncbi:MAG: 50S ribosomal protein L4 [Chloroflexi bacterium RBG_16_57_8]|nr:MAG: 50S ribosomal protein L4 [Chloroflexi bacterium RBG_16_57_8]
MQVPVRSTTGETVKQIEVSDYVFGMSPNQTVAHQALLRQLANERQGNASAKTRGQVAGSSKKLYAQKHTGRARAGSMKSPLRRGGGVIFPPIPRDYHQALPKKMRRLALRSVLSSKVAENELIVLEDLRLDAPKTKEMAKILTALGVASSALIATNQPDQNFVKSARNLPGVATMPASLLNVADIMSHKILLMTVEAVRRAEELGGEGTSRGDDSASV